MAENEFLEPFERMLVKLFGPAETRAIEQGGDWSNAWQEIEESGFLDALVPDEKGGVGLSPAQACPLRIALGKHSVPLPVGETMIARGILAGTDNEIPAGAIALATGALVVPNGLAAQHLLGLTGDDIWVCEAGDAQLQEIGISGSLDALIETQPVVSRSIGGDGEALRLNAALLRSACMAGAAQRVLDMSVSYANERVQFGKPIGRQQAIQQQLAVMAEQVVAMRLSVELACEAGGALSLNTVATTKALTSEYAPLVANCAHGVHGAIGISEEYDLQLYTRRLQAWSRADGGADFWGARIGELMIVSGDNPVDWVRGNLFG
jgi:alkylation response protein AidB-like acyl-CoA dehydrogenase